MEATKYRIGNFDDAGQLKELALISYGQFQGALSVENWGKLRSHLSNEDLFRNLLRTSRCFVCEEGNKIIGMAFLVPQGNPTDIFQSDWSYIRMVGVDPHSSGKGIGRQLTKMCIDFARSRGEKVVALHTSEFMASARHIYQALGFKQIKEIESRYGKRYWLYRLEL